jgi:uncharacterized protein
MWKVKQDTYIYKVPDNKVFNDFYLLVNLVMGSVDYLKKDTLNRISEGDNNLSKELRKYFSKIDLSYSEELSLFYDLYMQSLKKNVRPEVIIIPWMDCDLNCSYCWQHNQRLDSEINTSAFQKIIQPSIIYFKDSGWHLTPEVNIFGGEPLLDDDKKKRIVLELVNELKENNLSCHFTTSGYHLDRYIDEFYGLGIDGFQITIDGPSETHNKRRKLKNNEGTFLKIMGNVKLAIQYGFNVSIRVNMDMDNVDSIDELLIYFFKEGLINSSNFSVYFSPVTDRSCVNAACNINKAQTLDMLVNKIRGLPGESHYSLEFWRGADVVYKLSQKQTLELPRFHYCQASYKGQLVFSPDGFIHCCLESVSDNQKSIGTWKDVFSIDEKKWDQWATPVTALDECNDCNSRLFCGGGCVFGRLKAKENGSSYCEMIPEQLEVIFRHYWDLILINNQGKHYEDSVGSANC